MTRARPTPDTVTLHVPFRMVKRGGRKELLLPPETAAERTRIDNSLVKALARAFRWRRMLESGDYSGLTDLAAAEKINLSYLSRVLRLTLLAPEIIETVLDGQPSKAVTLPALMVPFSSAWEQQRREFLDERS